MNTGERKSAVLIHIWLGQPWGATEQSITVVKLLKLLSALLVLILNHSSHLLDLPG